MLHPTFGGGGATTLSSDVPPETRPVASDIVRAKRLSLRSDSCVRKVPRPFEKAESGTLIFRIVPPGWNAQSEIINASELKNEKHTGMIRSWNGACPPRIKLRKISVNVCRSGVAWYATPTCPIDSEITTFRGHGRSGEVERLDRQTELHNDKDEKGEGQHDMLGGVSCAEDIGTDLQVWLLLDMLSTH